MRVIYGGGGVCMRGHFEREGEVLLLNQRKLEFFLEAYSSFFLLSLRFLQPLVLLNVFLFFFTVRLLLWQPASISVHWTNLIIIHFISFLFSYLHSSYC